MRMMICPVVSRAMTTRPVGVGSVDSVTISLLILSLDSSQMLFQVRKLLESSGQSRTQFRISQLTSCGKFPIELVDLPLFLTQLGILLVNRVFHLVESSA